VDDREGEEQILAGLLLEPSVSLMPLRALQVETVNEDTLVDGLNLFALNSAVVTRNNLLHNFGLVVDLIERPVF